jgi:hypothetical protein
MGEKSIFQSKTVLGGVATFAILALSLWGFDLTTEDKDTITKAVLTLGGAISTILMAYGRKTAKDKIK